MPAVRPSARTRVAAALGRSTARLARVVRPGGGSVIGARVTLALAPNALEELAAGRRIAVVSGTNGKSTTTAFLAAAGTAAGHEVVSNIEGANLRTGIVATLSQKHAADLAVLEIDELALPLLLPTLPSPVITLLNLSRDQLDRFGEVRTIAASWRTALEARDDATVVANADDPLVVWGASGAADVTFVGVGLGWRLDAASCPNCGGRIVVADRQAVSADWWCDTCDLRRPPCLELDGAELRDQAGVVVATIAPGVPGRHNVGNAALAVVAAMKLGIDVNVAAAAMADVSSVAGRYQRVRVGDTEVRLLLAKNPAGWAEMLTLTSGADVPLVLGINARIADGKDPSWLWDVEYERCRGRRVVAAGERASDLAVRLHYAEVPCDVWGGNVDALLRGLGTIDAPEVDLIANYTVFADLVRELRAR
jgi:UDP-N-acetylmuramyl tripeptide synthase